MKHEKSCGAVIARQAAEGWETLLILNRKGIWSFPKGHVEPGETETQTAVREIREETGLTVEVDTRFRHVETYRPKDDVEKDVVLFLGRPLSGEETPQLSEIQTLRWCSLAEAFRLVSREGDQDALRMAAARLCTEQA